MMGVDDNLLFEAQKKLGLVLATVKFVFSLSAKWFFKSIYLPFLLFPHSSGLCDT